MKDTYKPVPLSILQADCDLHWGDISRAFNSELIDWKDVVSFAKEKIQKGNANLDEKDLAAMTMNDRPFLMERTTILANQAQEIGETTFKAWCKACLKWVYENRDKYQNPLEIVALIYADFDYPNDMASFVYYMPVTDGYDPSKYSREANRQRLMDLWKAYAV